MPDLDIGQTTTPTAITDFSVSPESTDGVSDLKETIHDNPDFTKWYGKYKTIAKIQKAIQAYATWVVGQGWTADDATTQELNNIRGGGEDTWLSILWNMLVVKKVNGDSYSEVIRNKEGRLINVKPLSPENVKVIWNRAGIIEKYKVKSTKGGVEVTVQPENMFHLMNDRFADNIHGQSVIEAVEWNIEAQEEARRTHRKMIKRNGIVRVIEIATEDTAKRAAFKIEWKEAIENGDVLILPKGVAEAKDWHGQLDTAGVISWLNYLDDEFFMMIGVPKIILSASGEIEGDSKVSYLAFQQIYTREINELKADILNQLAITLKFNTPASLQNTVNDNEIKNTSQTGFQPNDTTAGVGA